MIKVCHVTSVHPAKDARIFHKECRSLAKEYEVYLIAPNVKDEIAEGVHILGVTLPKSRLKRMMNLNAIYQKALEVDAAVYHLHDPELLITGLKLKHKGKKVIFDSHEDVPQQLLEKGYYPSWCKKPISSAYTLIEKFCLKHYDAVISVTPSIVERLATINHQTVMITNYPSFEELPINQRVNGGGYICFAGGVGGHYMHENIIEALKYTKARYLLAGPCYNPSYLERLKSMEMWNKVDYLGVVSHDKVREIYQRSDVGLVLIDYIPNVGYHRGTLGVLKMFEYMMVGIPVIATDLDLWKEIIEGCGCGICVNPHDIKAIANAINYYLDNPDKAREAGEKGRKAVKENYNWGTQEIKLLELYDRLL